MKQEALAIASKLDRTYISLLELGERNPSLYTMLALCQGLGISLAQFSAEIEIQIQYLNEQDHSQDGA